MKRDRAEAAAQSRKLVHVLSTSTPSSAPQLTVFSLRVRLRGFRLALCVLLLIGASGCASGLMNLSGANVIGSKFAELLDKDKDELADDTDNDFETRVDTPLLGDYMSVTGNTIVALRGVGLVTGLDGTGGDPPPSHLRKELLDEMNRRKIPKPGRLLASRNTALVMVTAYLPAMVRKGQHFDVRVSLPPNSEATSLKGGTLLETRLAEERTVQGRGNIKGHMHAVAHGAILTALGADGDSKVNPAMLRRGSVPGGAVSSSERHLQVILRNEYRGLKTSKRIENAISHRLHHYNRFGQRVSMAEAKTDMMLELKVHPLYRNNFPRYQQMIRSIAFRETDVARRMRIQQLSEDLLVPEKAEKSALRLEAIGADAIPFLQSALASSSLEVRFHAAQALAYLEDSSGVEVLKSAASDEPAFRVFALAALSVVKDADGIVALRDLTQDGALETRYGAVRALKENHPQDSALGTMEFPRQFVVHVVKSEADPAVHVVRYRSPEIVIFGARQELRLPMVLSAGSRIQVIGRGGDNHISITKYAIDQEPKRVESSTNLVDVVRHLADLGATYPDIVQLLLEAEAQNNLMGELGIDRLPQAGRVFARQIRSSDAEGSTKKAKLGTPSLTPGLFDRVEDSDHSEAAEDDESALARMFAMNDGDSADNATEPETSTDTAAEQNDSFDAELAEPGDDSAGDGEPKVTNEDDDFVLEETEFREPLGSRIKRMFRLPFGTQED